MCSRLTVTVSYDPSLVFELKLKKVKVQPKKGMISVYCTTYEFFYVYTTDLYDNHKKISVIGLVINFLKNQLSLKNIKISNFSTILVLYTGVFLLFVSACLYRYEIWKEKQASASHMVTCSLPSQVCRRHEINSHTVGGEFILKIRQ